MAFRWLNNIDSHNEEVEYQNLVKETAGRLLELKYDPDDELTKEQRNIAYSIIIKHLVEKLPLLEHTEYVWKLAKQVPSCFFPIIQDIARNC